MTVQYHYHIGKVGDDMSQSRMEIQESTTQGNYLGNGTGGNSKHNDYWKREDIFYDKTNKITHNSSSC